MPRALAVLLALALGAACGARGGSGAAPPVDPLSTVPPERLYQTGMALARGGDPVRAQQYLVAAQARGYPEEKTAPALVRVCVAAGQFRAALRYAEPFLARNPDAWPVRYLAAAIYLELGEPDRARRYLEQVVRQAPDAPAPRFLLAMTLRDSFHDRDAAAPHFQRYLELAPAGEHAAESRSALAPPDAAPPGPPEKIEATP